MHELSVAERLVRLVEEHARRAGARRVLTIAIRLGAHSHIAEEALRFYFQQLATGGLAAGARLQIERVPMRSHCHACNAEYAPEAEDWRCPRCGRVGRLLDAGDELWVESLEIEAGGGEPS